MTRKQYEQLHGWDSRTPFITALMRPLQFFVDAYKDLTNTFKPYKGWYQSNHDFLQPVYGVGNLMLGAWASALTGLAITLTPLVLIIAAGILSYNFFFKENRKKSDQRIYDYCADYLQSLVSWPIVAVSTVLRGLTQLAFTPLTWFIKMPLRGLLTLVKGRPKIEESESMQRLSLRGKALLNTAAINEDGLVELNNSMALIIKALLAKLIHSQKKGKLTDLTEKQIAKAKTELTVIARSWNYNDSNNPEDIQWQPASKKVLEDCFTIFAPKRNGAINLSAADDLRRDYKV
ncbi:MAG: hypothetical protein H0U70_01930 [Tatlockia sp.]|nr:hypothetical protein [Tatlockia sp.]